MAHIGDETVLKFGRLHCYLLSFSPPLYLSLLRLSEHPRLNKVIFQVRVARARGQQASLQHAKAYQQKHKCAGDHFGYVKQRPGGISALCRIDANF